MTVFALILFSLMIASGNGFAVPTAVIVSAIILYLVATGFNSATLTIDGETIGKRAPARPLFPADIILLAVIVSCAGFVIPWYAWLYFAFHCLVYVLAYIAYWIHTYQNAL